MRRLLEALRPETDREATLYLGLALLSAGLLAVWPPLPLLVPGALLLALAIVATDDSALRAIRGDPGSVQGAADRRGRV